MNKFTSHGYDYAVLDNGVIEQIAPEPFVYDSKYVATYDTPDYVRGNETLQALRYGFVCGAHGVTPDSLLDIGCANGAFVKFAQQHTDAKGYDITGELVPGIIVVAKLQPAAVWTFWDVLEHIHKPDFLHDAPCDTICVSLPYCHLDTQDLSWFHNKYKHRKPNEHVRHFNPASLCSFMLQYGWNSVAMSTHEDIVRKSTHGLENILSMAFKH